MANTNAAGIEYIGNGNSSGTVIGRTATETIGFFGTTPVAQQSVAATAAPAIDPTVSGSALVASIHSIAIGAASVANANRTLLTNLGLGA